MQIEMAEPGEIDTIHSYVAAAKQESACISIIFSFRNVQRLYITSNSMQAHWQEGGDLLTFMWHMAMNCKNDSIETKITIRMTIQIVGKGNLL